MADCTNTAEFLAEWARMHDAQQRDEHGFPKETCTDDNCIGCPLDIGLDCKEFAFRNINHAINKVQKWSDANPLPRPKTYLDVLFDRNPESSYPREEMMRRLCRTKHFGESGCPADEGDVASCVECWNEPYPKQEK